MNDDAMFRGLQAEAMQMNLKLGDVNEVRGTMKDVSIFTLARELHLCPRGFDGEWVGVG